MTLLPRDLKSGQSALLQHTAGQFRAEALNLRRAPVDAADAQMAERRKLAVSKERVLIRCRMVWQRDGMFRKAVERFDVLHVNGRVQGIVAAGCVWWEEAVQIAKDALRGRVSVSLAGVRTNFAAGGSLAVADGQLVGAKGLTENEGEGWKRPAPGEVLEVKR